MSLRGLLMTILAVGLLLVAMVGMFWVFDVLPLVAIFGLAAYYAVQSARRPESEAGGEADGRVP